MSMVGIFILSPSILLLVLHDYVLDLELSVRYLQKQISVTKMVLIIQFTYARGINCLSLLHHGEKLTYSSFSFQNHFLLTSTKNFVGALNDLVHAETCYNRSHGSLSRVLHH